MRQHLIDALMYPRTLVLQSIDEQDCPHDTLFVADSERCHHCSLNRECHWIRCLNEFADFKQQANHTLNASLRYGIKLVEIQSKKLQHDQTTCQCEACTWARDAQRLTESFDLQLLMNMTTIRFKAVKASIRN